jgi:hypothetical protein
MLVNMLADRFDDALAAARNISNEMEIQLGQITLREDWAAQNLRFSGKDDEARQAAAAALFRLKGLRAQLGEDRRIDLAEARIRALQGAGPDEVRALVEKARSAAPADKLAAFELELRYAQIYAIAGMVKEALEAIEPILQPPSDTSVKRLELDPAFDAIRNDPEFIAMLERNR